MSKPSYIQFTHTVFVTSADVDLSIENDTASIELTDFDAEAEVKIYQDQLTMFTDEQLEWLLTCCGLELQKRLS